MKRSFLCARSCRFHSHQYPDSPVLLHLTEQRSGGLLDKHNIESREFFKLPAYRLIGLLRRNNFQLRAPSSRGDARQTRAEQNKRCRFRDRCIRLKIIGDVLKRLEARSKTLIEEG